MDEFMLTDEEIIETTRVDMFLPNGELDPDCGYLRGRQQVAKAQARKLLEAISRKVEALDGTYYLIPDYAKFKEAVKSIGVDDVTRD